MYRESNLLFVNVYIQYSCTFSFLEFMLILSMESLKLALYPYITMGYCMFISMVYSKITMKQTSFNQLKVIF